MFRRVFAIGVALAVVSLYGARADEVEGEEEVAIPEQALAQEELPPVAQEAPVAQDEERRLIEEIVVTATKREESVQDIPIAVSAYRGEDLAYRGIGDLEDLMEVSPSLTVYSSNSDSNGGTLRIRGMGTTGNNPGLESAVGTFIDGVYRSRAGIAYSDLLDVERVEILRGPQGTLFGKNTSAGAVQIITKKPEFDWGGWVESRFGNRDYRRFASGITGPLIEEELAFSLAGSVSDRDGYYSKIGSSRGFRELERWSVRGQLLWTPNDDVDVRVIVDYAEKEESCCPAVYTRISPTTGPTMAALGASLSTNLDGRRVGTNFDPNEEIEDWGLSVETNWDLDWATATLLVSYREFDVEGRGQDIDFSDANILQPQNADESFENFSIEGRLNGTWEDLDWLVGVYAYTEDIETDGHIRLASEGDEYIAFYVNVVYNGSATLMALPPPGVTAADLDTPGGFGFSEKYEQETDGFAIFTHNVYHVTEDLSATLGIRYNSEDKDAKGIINGAPPETFINEPPCEFTSTGAAADLVTRVILQLLTVCNNASFDRDRDEDKLTGTFALSYQLMDDVNSYASFSRGYKAGGYNLDQQANNMGLFSTLDTVDFKREISDSYEVGVKSQWLEGELTVNLAAFYTEFTDFQLNTFTGLGFIVGNVGEVETIGGEIEAAWAPFPGVLTTFGFTYADTDYGDNLDPVVAGLEGERITHAPAYSANFGLFAEREVPELSDWTALFNSNLFYRGRHNTGSDLDKPKFQKGYFIWNAQIGVRSPEGAWEFTLWGNNLTDKTVKTLVFDTPFQNRGDEGSFSTFVNEPRMYGATLKRYF